MRGCCRRKGQVAEGGAPSRVVYIFFAGLFCWVVFCWGHAMKKRGTLCKRRPVLGPSAGMCVSLPLSSATTARSDEQFAGSAAVCPENRWILDGIDAADSFMFNLHKW